MTSVRGEFLTPDSDRWSEILLTHEHDIYHLPEYVSLMADNEAGEALAFVGEDDGSIFMIPLIIRPLEPLGSDSATLFDATSPYGYPGPLLGLNPDAEDADATDFAHRAVKQFVVSLRERGIVTAFLRMHPLLPIPLAPLRQTGTLVQHGETVSIDLSLSEEELWRQTRQNHRRDIIKAKRLGHAAYMDDTRHGLAEFKDIYDETMDRVAASASYYFSTEHYTRLFERLGHHVHLCLIEINSEVAAAGIFFEKNGIVQYHLGGTRDKYLDRRPTKLMFDFVRNWAKRRGNHVFHLGGGLGRAHDQLFHFKVGFSKQLSPFHTWRLIADQEKYQQLCQERGVRDDPHRAVSDGFFPAYRRPVSQGTDSSTE